MTPQTSPVLLEQLVLGLPINQLAGVSQNHNVTEDARHPQSGTIYEITGAAGWVMAKFVLC